MKQYSADIFRKGKKILNISQSKELVFFAGMAEKRK